MDVRGVDGFRYSICLVHVDRSGEEEYFKYYRVADLEVRGDEATLVPAALDAGYGNQAENGDNPDYLYNPQERIRYEKRDSDFCLFRWQKDPSDQTRWQTWSPLNDPSLKRYNVPKEVIVRLCGSEAALRAELAAGIPFAGRTTPVFYIAYKKEGDEFVAASCDRNSFEFIDGTLKLREDLRNVRSTALSAPRVRLKSCEIIESAFPDTDYRCVYKGPDDVQADGNVLLRPLEYYAADYVKWLAGEEDLGLSKTDKRSLAKVIDAALARPDALEKYLGAGADVAELGALRIALCSISDESSDRARAFVKKALLEDDEFKRECMGDVLRESDAILAHRKDEIAKAEDELAAKRAELESAKKKLAMLDRQKEETSEEVDRLREEAASSKAVREAVMEELESNIALRLGLKAVAENGKDTQSRLYRPTCLAVAGNALECMEEEGPLFKTLSNNLRILGAASVAGDSQRQRDLAALSVMAALANDLPLAMPRSVAGIVADGLCAALTGECAGRVTIPTDYRDIQGAIDAVESLDSAVVVVDNVIDPVNEGVLNALLSHKCISFILFSYTSHESARLLPAEIWGQAFMPSVSALSVGTPADKGKLRWNRAGRVSLSIALDERLDQARSICGDLDTLAIDDDVALMAATVACAAEEISDEDPRSCISQHLALSTAQSTENLKSLSAWSADDAGLKCLGRRLRING